MGPHVTASAVLFIMSTTIIFCIRRDISSTTTSLAYLLCFETSSCGELVNRWHRGILPSVRSHLHVFPVKSVVLALRISREVQSISDSRLLILLSCLVGGRQLSKSQIEIVFRQHRYTNGHISSCSNPAVLLFLSQCICLFLSDYLVIDIGRKLQ